MSEVESCPLCGGKEFAKNGTEIICRNCGCVVGEERIDFGPEWRNFFGSDVDRSRVGLPHSPLYSEHEYTTIVELSKMALTGRRKRFIDGLRFISDAGAKLGLATSTIERAADIFRRAYHKNLHRGRSVNVLATAALMLSIREFGIPLSIREVCNRLRVKRRDVTRLIRIIINEMKIKPSRVGAEAFVKRICTELKLPNDVFKRAVLIARKLEMMYEMQGRSPYNIAFAAVYLASISLGMNVMVSSFKNIHSGAEIAVSNIMMVLKAKYGASDPREVAELIIMDGGPDIRN